MNGEAAMDSAKDPMIPLSCLETLKSKIRVSIKLHIQFKMSVLQHKREISLFHLKITQRKDLINMMFC